MFDWLVTAFRMIFEGMSSLAAGVTRLGVVVLVVVFVGAYIRALIMEPRTYVRATLGFAIAMLVGFGLPLVMAGITQANGVTVPEWLLLVLWPLGWVLASYAWMFVAGIPIEKSSPANATAPVKRPLISRPALVAEPMAAPNPLLVVEKHDFKAGDFVVYPTHGVGRIQKVDEQEVAGLNIELFVIVFEKDKMILRVPTAKAVGMRKLSTPDVVSAALDRLKGPARVDNAVWSHRARDCEAKINSGDLISIAEVVRDLNHADGPPERSNGERQLYEAALARMAREVAAIEGIDEQSAVKRVENALVKKPARL